MPLPLVYRTVRTGFAGVPLDHAWDLRERVASSSYIDTGSGISASLSMVTNDGFFLPVQWGMDGPLTNEQSNSIFFDGIGTYLPASSAGVLTYGAGSFSLNCWFKTTNSAGPNNALLAKANAYTLAVSGGLLKYFDWKAGAYISSGVTVSDNLWHMGTAVITGGTSLSLYVDGVLALSTTIQGVVSQGNLFAIGWNGFSSYFPGQISTGEIYGGALSGANVGTLWTAGGGGGYRIYAPLRIPAGTTVQLQVVPRSTVTGTVTVSDGGAGGTFGTMPSWSASNAIQYVSYTNNTPQTVTFTSTNNFGATDPQGNTAVVYSVGAVIGTKLSPSALWSGNAYSGWWSLAQSPIVSQPRVNGYDVGRYDDIHNQDLTGNSVQLAADIWEPTTGLPAKVRHHLEGNSWDCLSQSIILRNAGYPYAAYAATIDTTAAGKDGQGILIGEAFPTDVTLQRYVFLLSLAFNTFGGLPTKTVYLDSSATIACSSVVGTFFNLEPVIQQTSGAKAVCDGPITGTPLVLCSITGTPDATHLWVGQISGASATPTALPVYAGNDSTVVLADTTHPARTAQGAIQAAYNHGAVDFGGLNVYCKYVGPGTACHQFAMMATNNQVNYAQNRWINILPDPAIGGFATRLVSICNPASTGVRASKLHFGVPWDGRVYQQGPTTEWNASQDLWMGAGSELIGPGPYGGAGIGLTWTGGVYISDISVHDWSFGVQGAGFIRNCRFWRFSNDAIEYPGYVGGADVSDIAQEYLAGAHGDGIFIAQGSSQILIRGLYVHGCGSMEGIFFNWQNPPTETDIMFVLCDVSDAGNNIAEVALENLQLSNIAFWQSTIQLIFNPTGYLKNTSTPTYPSDRFTLRRNVLGQLNWVPGSYTPAPTNFLADQNHFVSGSAQGTHTTTGALTSTDWNPATFGPTLTSKLAAGRGASICLVDRLGQPMSGEIGAYASSKARQITIS